MNRRKLLKIALLSAAGVQLIPKIKTEHEKPVEVDSIMNGALSKMKVTPYQDKDGNWFLKHHPVTVARLNV